VRKARRDALDLVDLNRQVVVETRADCVPAIDEAALADVEGGEAERNIADAALGRARDREAIVDVAELLAVGNERDAPTVVLHDQLPPVGAEHHRTLE
jgi:hypothetical protein